MSPVKRRREHTFQAAEEVLTARIAFVLASLLLFSVGAAQLAEVIGEVVTVTTVLGQEFEVHDVTLRYVPPGVVSGSEMPVEAHGQPRSVKLDAVTMFTFDAETRAWYAHLVSEEVVKVLGGTLHLDGTVVTPNAAGYVGSLQYSLELGESSDEFLVLVIRASR